MEVEERNGDRRKQNFLGSSKESQVDLGIDYKDSSPVLAGGEPGTAVSLPQGHVSTFDLQMKLISSICVTEIPF